MPVLKLLPPSAHKYPPKFPKGGHPAKALI
nr:MAG TPA: hypothetical protein [Caudoviricetes sp.]DAG17442.1 MAG TPA: hypothetical protein [Caudoviricetes sp.]